MFGESLSQASQTHHYQEAGVEPVDNTPAEILALVQEMEARLAGSWVDQAGDDERQRAFWSLVPQESFWNGVLRARLGAEFLRAHEALLEAGVRSER
jgi:hypothetical protein